MSDSSETNETCHTSSNSQTTAHNLDLRGVACPMNFVKTRLLLDKLSVGEKLNVLLDDGEPVESVSHSIQQEGHTVLLCELQTGGHYRLLIQKADL
jgi:TusA-related sulfurtransferase